jgi:two-component SAPR family response regulator
MIIKTLKFILIGCICSLYCHSEESSGGLLFTSSAEKVNKRTSLVIFGDKFQKFEKSFNLSFDLSIWDIKQFGYVFRVINEQKQEVDFVFVNFYGVDKMYLDFHSPITHKSVQIPISEEAIMQKENLHLDVIFDLKEDKATIACKDSIYTCSPIGLSNPAFLQVAFGLYGLNLDVPQMLIKDIHIQGANAKPFYFPLNESEGDFATDETETLKAPVKNPEWIVNQHFYWQSNIKFELNGSVFITYDEPNNRILILNKDSILCYYPRDEKTESISALGSNDSITAYLKIMEGKTYLHSNCFYSQKGDLYQFGGYSNHTYSNTISKYNPEEKSWNTVEFTGDEISPRFYSAKGDGIAPDEKLIFGGFGNETGKQEHGGHNLYDLYVLNLEQKSITKLWDLQNHLEDVFIPCNNLILNKAKTHFYTLCYPHHISDTKMYLYCFDLNNGSYNIVSDSIHLISEDMNSSVYLFFNEVLNEFYAVTQEITDNNKTNISIYKLLSPPVLKTQLKGSLQKTDRTILWLILLFVILSTAFIIQQLLTKKKKNKNRQKQLSLQEEIYENKDRQTKSAIYIFGNFTVYDNKGRDISYRFSMKLRSLFSLILIHTNNNSKISTEKLTLSLWPEKDANETKNIRGVTINRLRNILSDMDGITLVHQNSQWYFVFDRPFYCDYLEYQTLIDQLKHPQIKDDSYEALMDKLVSIIREGDLFLNLQEAWIDSFKSKEEEKLELLLWNHIFYLYENKQYSKVIAVAPAFFNIEPLNDEIVDICMKSYQKLRKKEQAQGFLARYKETYKMMMGENYKG